MHKSITDERVLDACSASMFGTENPGFCLACGADHDACEPDAEGYECYECGEMQVMGAESVAMLIMYELAVELGHVEEHWSEDYSHAEFTGDAEGIRIVMETID